MIRDLVPPEMKSEISELMRLVDEKKGMIYETEHVRKDDTRFPVEVSARFFEVEGNRYLQAIIERKFGEAKKWHVLGRARFRGLNKVAI